MVGGSMYVGGDSDCTIDELKAYNEAMALNAELREKYGEIEGDADIDDEGRYQPPRRRINPRIKEQVPGSSSAAGMPMNNNVKVTRPFLKKKKDFTFNDMKKLDIEMENQSILSRLNRITVRKGKANRSANKYKPKQSSHTVNRRKKQTAEAQENMAFLKRLNNIKPTYSKREHAKKSKHQRKVVSLRRNVQTVKVRSKPRPEWHSTGGDIKQHTTKTGLGPSLIRSPRQRR